MADELWIDVLPSMAGFGAKLVKGANASAKEAGAKAGKGYSDAFEDGAGGASDAAVKELETAEKRAAGLVSKLAGDVSKARQTQQTATANLLTAEQRLADAVGKYGEDSKQAEAAALRLEAARGKASDAEGKFKNAENGLREAKKAHTTVTEQLADAEKKTADVVDEQPSKYGKFGSALETAKGKVENFSTSVGGIAVQATAALGGAALFTEAWSQAMDKQDMTSSLTAALGATEEQSRVYGEAAGSLYANAYGDSLEDVGTAVDAVVSSIGGMRDASQADIEKITGYAMNMADVFGVDVSEAAATAGSMIKNGLATDATNAFDLMTSSMQQIPASVRGEVLPVLDEYGKHFQGLGITGENAMKMITAASQDGAIGMDKIGDALKEFTIRGTDMSKSTTAAFDALGFNTQEMTNRLLAGGDSASTAMSEIVNALASVTDPGEQAAASIALFGTPLEDLGTDQIPAFLRQIDPLAGGLEAVPSAMRDTIAPAMEKYGDTMALVGAEGKNAMGLIVLAGEEGAQSMDTVSGALSSFASNAAELTPEAEKAYKAIGLSGKSMVKGISQGGQKAEKAFAQIMAGLRGIEDPAEQAKAATALFGDGIKGIAEKDLPAFLAQIDPATASMAEIPSAMPDMSKYAKEFQALGIEGSTALGLVTKASQDGAYSMDLVSGSLQQFTTRATDMSEASVSAYGTIGLNAQDMATKLQAGGTDAKDAMGQIIGALQGVEDPSARAAAAVALFGDPVASLGQDEIPAFLEQINPLSTGLSEVAGTADAMGESLRSGTSGSLEGVKRSFMDLLSDGVQPLLGPAEAILRWIKDTPGVLPALGIGLGALATAWGVYTVAQLAANSAMLASPVTWVILAVVAAVALVVTAITHWGEIMGWLKTNVLDPFIAWITPAWNAVAAGFQAVWENVLKPVVDAFAAAGKWLWETILQPIFNYIVTYWTNVATSVQWAWVNLLKPAWDAVAAGAKWLWTNVLSPVFGWIGDKWSKLANGVKTLWTTVLKVAWDAVAAAAKWLWESVLSPVFGWIGDKWSKTLAGIQLVWKTVLKPAWDAVSSAGKALWEKFLSPVFKSIGDKWDALTRGIGTVWEKFGKPVFDAIGALLKGDFITAFKKAKEAVDTVWKGIANIVRKPINFVIGTVYNNGFKALFNGISEKLGLSWRLPDVGELPAYAKGGLAQSGWALVGEEGPELVNFSAPGRVYTAKETQAMLGGREQAPEGALPVLAGPSAGQSTGLPVGGFWGDVWKNIEGGVKGAMSWVRGRIGDGLRAMTAPIKGAMKAALPGAGINELIRDSGVSLIDSMIKKVAGEDDEQQAAAEAAGEGSAAVYEGALGAFHRPSKGPFTSMFGPRWGAFHAGVDIAGGGPTYAALPGTVQKVGWNAVAGRTGIGIVLNHGPGLWTYYGHNPSLGAVKVRPGDTVKGGQHIGQQGATGNVTGTHLHFEVHKGRVGAAVNPMQYLKYDTGGVLQPGLTPTLNLTGRPEYVFTQPQWTTLDALAARGADAAAGGGDYYVTISVEELEGIKTLEDFLAMARRRARQKVGA